MLGETLLGRRRALAVVIDAGPAIVTRTASDDVVAGIREAEVIAGPEAAPPPHALNAVSATTAASARAET